MKKTYTILLGNSQIVIRNIVSIAWRNLQSYFN